MHTVTRAVRPLARKVVQNHAHQQARLYSTKVPNEFSTPPPQVPMVQQMPKDPVPRFQTPPEMQQSGQSWSLMGFIQGLVTTSGPTMSVDPSSPNFIAPTVTHSLGKDGRISGPMGKLSGGISGALYVETVGTPNGMQVPKDAGAQVGADVQYKASERRDGSKFTRTVGVGGKASLVNAVSSGEVVTVSGSYAVIDERTGRGKKYEGSTGFDVATFTLGSSGLPNVSVEDVSDVEKMLKCKFEQITIKDIMAEMRVTHEDFLENVARENDFNSIDGNGMDPSVSREVVESAFFFPIAAREGRDLRNQKFGENFENPRRWEGVYGSQETLWQKSTRVMEQVAYGQNGKDGRLAPKKQGPEQEGPEVEGEEQGTQKQKTPTQKTTEQEGPEVEGEEVSAEKQEAPQQKAPTQKTTEQEGPEVEGEEVESQKQEGPKKEIPKQKIPEQEEEQEKESHEQEGPEKGLVKSQGRNRNEGGGGGGDGRQQPEFGVEIPKYAGNVDHRRGHRDDDDDESQEMDAQEIDAQSLKAKLDSQEVEGQEVEAQEVAPRKLSVREMLGKAPKSPGMQQGQGQGQGQGGVVRDQVKRDPEAQKTGSKMGVS